MENDMADEASDSKNVPAIEQPKRKRRRLKMLEPRLKTLEPRIKTLPPRISTLSDDELDND